MDTYDPSVPVLGEDQQPIREMEYQVNIAYEDSLSELETLHNLTLRFEPPPPDNDFEALKRYRRTIVRDVARLELKIRLCKAYLQARDRRFHYHAKRLRTRDRSARLRWWWRQKMQEIEAARLQGGEEAAARARSGVEETIRVTVNCYGLQDLWKEAMEAEGADAVQMG